MTLSQYLEDDGKKRKLRLRTEPLLSNELESDGK